MQGEGGSTGDGPGCGEGKENGEKTFHSHGHGALIVVELYCQKNIMPRVLLGFKDSSREFITRTLNRITSLKVVFCDNLLKIN